MGTAGHREANGTGRHRLGNSDGEPSRDSASALCITDAALVIWAKAIIFAPAGTSLPPPPPPPPPFAIPKKMAAHTFAIPKVCDSEGPPRGHAAAATAAAAAEGFAPQPMAQSPSPPPSKRSFAAPRSRDSQPPAFSPSRKRPIPYRQPSSPPVRHSGPPLYHNPHHKVMCDFGLAATPKHRGPEADALDSPAKRKRLGWEAKKACTDGILNTDDTKSNPVSTPAKERG